MLVHLKMEHPPQLPTEVVPVSPKIRSGDLLLVVAAVIGQQIMLAASERTQLAISAACALGSGVTGHVPAMSGFLC